MKRAIKKMDKQGGFGLIEIMIVIAIGGILAAFIYTMSMGVMDRSRASNDVSAFLVLVTDIHTFLGPSGMSGLNNNIVVGLAPNNMVVAGTAASGSGTSAVVAVAASLINSHGGDVTIGYTAPNIVITSADYSEEGCIKLVSVAAAASSTIRVGGASGTRTLVKLAGAQTHNPSLTLQHCAGAARTIDIAI